MFGGLLLNLSDKVWAKRVKIHVPFKVRHHHHTHTVLKHVHHKVENDNINNILNTY